MIPAVEVADVVHSYGSRRALEGVSFAIEPSEIFALLGPNGGGKTTLFRLISTLIPLQQGAIRIQGQALPEAMARVRRSLGVVFQAPSLDKKLTVRENLQYQGLLYGLKGAALTERINEMLARLSIADRAQDRVETLSGGLRRRVEVAKGLLHRPSLLLLDEPSTGLDPGARADLWEYLKALRTSEGTTIVLTTHLLEEADRVDRLGILNEGQLVALDTPERLRASVGGDTITIETEAPATLAANINEQFHVGARVIDGTVRFEQANAHEMVTRLIEAFPKAIQALRLGKPTLEDVFIARTGHRLWHDRGEAA